MPYCGPLVAPFSSGQKGQKHPCQAARIIYPVLMCSVYHLLQPAPQGVHTFEFAASGGNSDLLSLEAGTLEDSFPWAITDLDIATVATVSRFIRPKQNR